MTFLLDATLKVSFIAAVGLLTVTFLRRHSAAFRHWILAATVVAASVVPLLTPIAPGWIVPLPAPRILASTTSPSSFEASRPNVSAIAPAVPTAASQSSGVGLMDALLAIWAAGAILTLLFLFVGLARVARVAARAESNDDPRTNQMLTRLMSSLGLRQMVRLGRSAHPGMPATWGFLRPAIVLPESSSDWSDDRLQLVLLHELTHIRRRDWAMQMFAECVRALHWFNPLVWIAANRLRHESEQACDDEVLRSGADAGEYASHLLALARAALSERPLAPLPVQSMARPSSFERRFAAMLNPNLDRASMTRSKRVATTVAAAAVAVLVAGLSLAQTFSTLSGAVVDATNRSVPNVTLTLVNSSTHAKYEVKSDAAGHYEFVGLPPGRYTWEAALPGFSRMSGTVDVGNRSVQQNVPLQVGKMEETITVRGGTPSPETPDNAASARTETPAINVAEARKRWLDKTCEAGVTGGVIRPPVKLADSVPQYPESLQLAKIGGTVVLDATVNSSGDVSDVSVVRSPESMLAAAAVDAVRRWQYAPTILNCEPIETHFVVAVNFSAQ
ncbi:MAG TPA: M56 family metallopeptidase [Vicinamibacterales bacterium]|nr:M56 family metallopeptidase [Vicinamibacterales bacterium]